MRIVTEKCCRKCGEIKPAAEFHYSANSKDGLASTCKACKREYYRRRRDGLPLLPSVWKIRAIRSPVKRCIKCGKTKPKDEFTTDRKHVDGKYPICQSCASEIQRERYAANRSHYLLSSQKCNLAHPEKVHARMLLNQHVVSGDIVKPKSCSACGDTHRRLEAHHWHGYDAKHALDVIWLCSKCHGLADREV